MYRRAMASSSSPKRKRLSRDVRVNIDIGEAAEARGGIGGAHDYSPPLLFSRFFINCSRFVGVENAFEVIHFVLENVRKKIRCAARESLSMFIICPNGRFLGARYCAPKSAYRKAPFVLFFFRAGYFRHLGIYIHLVGERCRSIRFFSLFVRSVPRTASERFSRDDEKPYRLSDLGCRQRHAELFFRKEHFHFLDEALGAFPFDIGNKNRCCGLSQGRILLFGQNCSHWRNYTRKLKIKRAARGGSNWSGPE